MSDRHHATSIGRGEDALRAAFLKCAEPMKLRWCLVIGWAAHNKHNLEEIIRRVFGDDVVRVLDRDYDSMKGCAYRSALFTVANSLAISAAFPLTP